MRKIRSYFILFSLAYCTAHAQIAKPYLLKDYGITQNSTDTELYNFTVLNGKAYYACFENCSGLLTSDGTVNGTHPVKSVNAYMFDSIAPFPILKDKFFFVGQTESNENEVWVSDGTSQGTLALGPLGKSRDPEITPATDVVYYKYALEGFETLYVSDGTTAGTKPLNTFQLADLSSSSYLHFVQTLGNRLYFTKRNANAATALWTTDGTIAGTVFLKSFPPASDSNLSGFKELNGKVFFTLSNVTGSYLYVTNNTQAGTKKLASLNVDSQPPYVAFGDYLIFNRQFQDGSSELYRTDGKLGTTKYITSAGSFLASDFLKLNGKLFFMGQIFNNAKRLYCLNPDLQPPVLVDDLNYTIEKGAQPPVAFKGKIYFEAYDYSDNQTKLWVSSGEAGTTQIFTSPYQPNGFKDPRDLFVLHDQLYFWASKYDNFGNDLPLLYRTDGTPGNTNQIKHVNWKPGSSRFIVAGNTLYVTAIDDDIDNPSDYASLWMVDDAANVAYLMVPDSAKYDYLVSGSTVVPFSDGLLIHNRFNDEIGKELYVIHNDGTDETGYPIGMEIPNIHIYPNPSTGQVHFDLGSEGQVRTVVINYSTGQFFQRLRFDSTQTSFDVDFPVQGVYFLTITFRNGRQATKRIVIS